MTFRGSVAKSAVCAVISFLLFNVVGDNLLLAQLSTGTITGAVKDQSEAVLPAATVKVTHLDTGVARTTVTGSNGGYRIPNLPPGAYEVQAEISGFQTAIRRGITLSVGREAVVDLTLSVGDVAQKIIVTGEAPLIETTTSMVSGLVDPAQMREIPLNSRSFIELVPLTAGATFAENADSSATKGFGRKLSISGSRYNANSFLLDGADINDAAGVAGSAAQTMTGVETVREFRVITNAYDAEFGRHSGGVISAVTKSGANQIHGSAFEFLRNDNFDARNFFDRDPGNLKRSDPPAFARNQFGGTAGGPVIKDRTFFFLSYEGLRERRGFTKVFEVPGLQMRQGLLRGQSIGINPAIKPFLDSYPLPNRPDRADGTAQLFEPLKESTTDNFGTGRGDFRISDSDSLFVRFSADNAEQFRPGENGVNTGGQAKTQNRFSTIEETHVFSPTLLARTHFTFNRTRLDFFDVPLPGLNFPKFSFGSAPDVPGVINVSSLTNTGGSSTNPKRHIQNLFQFKEDVFYTTGRHSFKFGGQGERFQFNQRSDFFAGGQFSFDSLADFLRKDVSSANFIRPGSDDIRGWRENLFGLYAQDDIQVKPGLTINLGLRYEFITVPTEANGKIATIRDISDRKLFVTTPEQTDIGEPFFLNPSLKNFEPRVGFAWAPFKDGKTSVRGGFGIFHDQILPSTFITAGVRVPPFFAVAELFRENTPIDFPNAFTSQRSALIANVGSKPQVDGLQFDISQPRIMKWSFDIEREIFRNTTVDVGYSGTRGVHLTRGAIMLNTTPATTVNGRRFFLVDEDLPNPFFNRIRWRITDGTSDYHSFRLTVDRRFSQGLQFHAAYTVSKSTDDSSTTTGSSDFNDSDRRGFRTEKEHGLSAFDVRQIFVANVVYEVPLGKNLTGAAGKLLGGWSVSSLMRFNSGNPVSLAADQPRRGDRRLRFVEGSTVDLIPGGDQNPTRSRNPDQFFDPSQFAFPTPFFQGNLGRNHLITPGVANFDFTVIKDTPAPTHVLGEAARLQFRAEFFNLFNRANFGSPSVSVFDRNGRPKSNAGVITDTRTSSRQIQFALKLVF